ncbi:MAG TPA: carboxy terminal-processing peptidase [Puia sp.]|jgi:carboxyl-terminal processing protease|nr:carboxy terminal-processing peptidase [Puia sp.]
MSKFFEYMFNKRNLPVVLLVLACGVFVAFRSLGFKSEPPTKYEKILRDVGVMLEDVHYSPKAIDDKFSKEVFTKYLSEKVDVEKDILLKTDIDALRKYETKIDDEILGKTPVQFEPAVTAVLKRRIPETEAIYKDILSHPFDFTKDESINEDYDKMDFPKSEADRKEAWRKHLKYLTLERYTDLIDQQEAAKSKAGYVVKTNAELEKEARDKVMKLMDRYYDRLKYKINEDDRFNMFVETIVQAMDPHTDYFPPVDKRYFDEQMSGHFFGIGATLKEEDGNIKIGELLTGMPAWKSGQINGGDIILKVGQGAQEPVDLTGYETEDAIKLIRGEKGTEVRLTIKKADGTVKTVSLIRDEIVQDETFARSVIVNGEKGKIGYIYLPEFYADFENPKAHRCSIDVAKEILKLKEEKVDGIVIDLRNNGGGSLYDVVQMVGLFIDQGPVVQVRDRDGKPHVYNDQDKALLYDGPLAVMVNEYSASASEIFAAAIQDYKRGVIIGSTSTYGKGTVQRNIELDKSLGFSDANNDLGTIKLTLQKFYRISGGSTQLRGVASDVVLPDILEYSKVREKDNPDALPWDEIQKADYKTWKYAYDLNPIVKASEERLKNDSAFSIINKDAAWLNDQNDKSHSINIDKYRQEQKKWSGTVKQIETLSKLQNELKIETLPQDAGKYDNDKDKADRYARWLKGLQKDIWLNEAVKVVDDMVASKSLVYK